MPLRFAFRLFKHGSLWAYRLSTIAVLAAGLLFAVVVLLLRYWVLPHIDDYRSHIVAGLTRATHQRFAIGRIEGEWDGYRPRLILRDLSLLDDHGQERLKLEEVDSTLAWLSLFAGELRFYSIEVQQLSLEVRVDANGGVKVAGIPVGASSADNGLGDWLLEQNRIVLRDSRLTWIDERLGGKPLNLEDVEILVEQRFGAHRFGLRAKPPVDVASPIDLRGDLRGRSFGDPPGWSGRLYLSIGSANLGALREWFKLPMQTTEGSGGLQVWTVLQQGQPREITADVSLSDVHVRLRDDLPELQLSSLRGRLGWHSDANSMAIWARGLRFTTPDGVDLPPADISYSRTLPRAGRPPESEVVFDAVELDAVTRLVDRLPIDAAVRARLTELNPLGRLHDVRLTWRDRFDWSGPYTVRGGFREVAVSPTGFLPGVAHVSGQLEGNERGGSILLGATATELNMPRVFVGPIALDRLTVRASWTMAGGVPTVTFERAEVSNKDLAGEVSGRYQAIADAAGIVDLKGRFSRVSGPEAWRYIPRVVADPVREWLRHGLVSGTSNDVQFTLRGDLRHFPWGRTGDGLFEVVASVQDGTLDYAKRWPRLEGLRGQLAVHGSRLEITGTAGGVFQTRVAGVTAIIPDLGSSDPALELRAEVEGPTGDFVRYVRESPIKEHVGGLTDGLRASGTGKLSLSLDLPLDRRADTQVKGLYVFADNTLEASAELPVLEQFSGRLIFTQDDASLRDGMARVYGMPTRFTIARDGSGAMNIRATGQAEATQLRRELNHPWLAQVTGTAEWQLSAALDGRRDFVLESNLNGLGSSLPLPFAKAQQDRVPLRIERRERTRTEDLLIITYGDSMSAQLLLEKAGKTKVTRGEIVLGGNAPEPKRDGVWIAGKLERVDLEQWQELLGPSDGAGPVVPAGLDLSTPQLRAISREFHDVQFTATRHEGSWQARLDSREVAGELKWSSEGAGTLVGRFSRLALPVATAELEPTSPRAIARAKEGKNLPTVDLTADDFKMGNRQFGKMSLLAVPDAADWRIERLELTSPDGTLNLTGLWQAWDVNPRTQIKVKLDVGDIGRYFTRMDLPQGIQGGKAKLEGQLSWSGPPYALDLPTLSGQLTLAANKGRFVKIDPGIGKLLSVVSLQTLPKVMTLDFKDIFGQGFAFDQITSGVDIVHGVARTNDFHMQGPAARVEMKGEVNLAGETQRLDVRIFPAMSDSVALGTALVNPAVGVGAWVLQKAFRDPIGHMLSLEYEVAGTWSAPAVAKKKREVVPQAPAGRR
jgi:uncharacterized protein (TIGR02099 family)